MTILDQIIRVLTQLILNLLIIKAFLPLKAARLIYKKFDLNKLNPNSSILSVV